MRFDNEATLRGSFGEAAVRTMHSKLLHERCLAVFQTCSMRLLSEAPLLLEATL